MDLILALNPLAFIIDAHRQALIHYASPDLMHLALIGVSSGAVIAIAVAYMRRNSQYLALKVLS